MTRPAGGGAAAAGTVAPGPAEQARGGDRDELRAACRRRPYHGDLVSRASESAWPGREFKPGSGQVIS